jgi:hypothetical protein
MANRNRIAVLKDGTEGFVLHTWRKGRGAHDETTYELMLDEVKGARPTGNERKIIVCRCRIERFYHE